MIVGELLNLLRTYKMGVTVQTTDDHSDSDVNFYSVYQAKALFYCFTNTTLVNHYNNPVTFWGVF